MRGMPAAERRSISAALVSAERIWGSFCKPSRGPTSCSNTVSRDSVVFTCIFPPSFLWRHLSKANAGLSGEKQPPRPWGTFRPKACPIDFMSTQALYHSFYRPCLRNPHVQPFSMVTKTPRMRDCIISLTLQCKGGEFADFPGPCGQERRWMISAVGGELLRYGHVA